MTLLSAEAWEQWLAGFPQAHLLQSRPWGELKATFGWEAVRLQEGDSGAQLLLRRLPGGLCLAYLPKGPVTAGPWQAAWRAIFPAIDALCRRRHAVFLKVEPDLWEGENPDLGSTLAAQGFRPAASIQPRRTLVLDLSGSEADWLARMHQKTRYNIRLAERKGVTVEPSADVATFYALAQQTAQRDGFAVHSLDYYRRAHELFGARGACALFIASYEGEPLAGLMAFCWGKRAYYLYGASSDRERERMPNYLLQWQAMRWAAAQGCTSYDLWGIPDEDEETLEANFTRRTDGLWSVYRFKRGFGGDPRRSAGAWDKVYHPALYRLYLRLRGRAEEGA
jgi:lipid II:glycine glycyltransferase (peptidoglycan interpeptide bridge formation enzyme)